MLVQPCTWAGGWKPGLCPVSAITSATSATTMMVRVISLSSLGRARPELPPRATCPVSQMSGASASTTAPAMMFVLSTAPPTAAKAIAVLVQASFVRSRAWFGSTSSGSSEWAIGSPDRRDQQDERRQQRDARDRHGQDHGQYRPGDGRAGAQGPLMPHPFAVPGRGDERAQQDQRYPDQVAAPRDAGKGGAKVNLASGSVPVLVPGLVPAGAPAAGADDPGSAPSGSSGGPLICPPPLC